MFVLLRERKKFCFFSADGFDSAAGMEWIYPVNLPVRDYQLEIVQTALFHNTMVVLPTGLGKTFIAAVVMYNYHRWFPRGENNKRTTV